MCATSKEVYKKNLKPSYRLERIKVGVFACIARESLASLILVTKRSKKERTSARDRLNLNASQFARKIHQPYTIPFICGLCASLIISILQQIK